MPSSWLNLKLSESINGLGNLASRTQCGSPSGLGAYLKCLLSREVLLEGFLRDERSESNQGLRLGR